jgi:hypothetical protein
VTRVDLGASGLDLDVPLDKPGVVRNGDTHRVARLDLEDGLQVGREVAVKYLRVERQLVEGH